MMMIKLERLYNSIIIDTIYDLSFSFNVGYVFTDFVIFILIIYEMF